MNPYTPPQLTEDAVDQPSKHKLDTLINLVFLVLFMVLPGVVLAVAVFF